MKKVIFGVALALAGILSIGLVVAGILAYRESQSSTYQSRYFGKLAQELTFTNGAGPSPRIHFPSEGPHNQRRGYTRLPEMISLLLKRGFRVERQAVISESLDKLAEKGFNPIFNETDQAGLTILDRSNKSIYSTVFPSPAYQDFDSIPLPIVNTLLLIEDRTLLDSQSVHRNPAVDWPRFGQSLVRYAGSRLGMKGNVPGASTLATQIEKFRYWPEGRTGSAQDKIRQMFAASLRAYLRGQNTLEARKSILLSYVNTAPLAAFAHYGEVNGLAEGMRVWYGADFDSVNILLRNPERSYPEAGRYYRMVVSLIVAHRRPHFYLTESPAALQTKTDQYLRLIQSRGIVPDSLCIEALRAPIPLRTSQQVARRMRPLIIKKPANTIRTPLLSLLGIQRMYELDRLNAVVSTTLDSTGIGQVSSLFTRLRETSFLDSLGLRGFRLLQKGDPHKVIHSFVLYERVGNQNVLRIQADSYEDDLNINEGVKLDLGSTAKLRTLITYLEVIEEIHIHLSHYSRSELDTLRIPPEDALSRWTRERLLTAADTSLSATLEAALLRSYSASTSERFFTGGGIHTFVNFDRRHDSQALTVLEAFRHSVNLVFVRMMRDIVRYHLHRSPDARQFLTDTTTNTRGQYLQRFIAHESSEFLGRFYRQLRSIPAHSLADSLARSIRPSASRLAAIYCSVDKDPTQSGLEQFLIRHGITPDRKQLDKAYKRCVGSDLTLSDRGFIANIHPLKLWTASYLARNPSASLAEIRQASTPYLEDVYRWLFRTRSESARSTRIRRMLEMEAFTAIHLRWQRLGFPFPDLVPSYATSLGASADRPSALAELAGIIQNDGMRYPTQRFTRIHFAAGTPYETDMVHEGADKGQRVLSVEVARATKKCMFDVVENGTAVRVRNAFRLDGKSYEIGGKTGTGDHRVRRFAKGGRKIEERVLNRTATFVFILGDRFFGTISAMVPGESAKEFAFTSSYPVQLLRQLSPSLLPLVTQTSSTATGMADVATPDTTAAVADVISVEDSVDNLIEMYPDSVPSSVIVPTEMDHEDDDE